MTTRWTTALLAILALVASCAREPVDRASPRPGVATAGGITTLTEHFERDGRPLPTTIWAPDGRGPFPIVLFSHGLGASPEGFRALFDDWVREGFVVVGPAYPHTNGRVALEPRDLSNQPADASFVLDSVIDLARDDEHPLSGRLDPERIAAVGHSMGGMTTVGLASACCADDRIDAGVVYAGDASGFRAEGFVDDAPPFLFVHGDADEIVSHASGHDAYEDASGPKAFVTLQGADHVTSFFDDASAHGSIVSRATLAFLRWTLLDDDAALADLRRIAKARDVRLEDELAPRSSGSR